VQEAIAMKKNSVPLPELNPQGYHLRNGQVDHLESPSFAPPPYHGSPGYTLGDTPSSLPSQQTLLTTPQMTESSSASHITINSAHQYPEASPASQSLHPDSVSHPVSVSNIELQNISPSPNNDDSSRFDAVKEHRLDIEQETQKPLSSASVNQADEASPYIFIDT